MLQVKKKKTEKWIPYEQIQLHIGTQEPVKRELKHQMQNINKINVFMGVFFSKRIFS